MTANAKSEAANGLRLAGLIVAAILALFSAAFIVGFLVAHFEEGGGSFSAKGLAALGLSALSCLLLAGLSWRLSAPWRQPGRSAFQKRYTRMWVTFGALGLPVGIFLGFVGDQDGPRPGDLFSNGPIDAHLAIAAAAVLLIMFVVTMLLYHRTIDDHEERAYLWANTGALYFLAAILPTAWLLERGGLVGPLGLGTAMLLLLASIAVQGLIWAWLKFR